MAPLHPNLARIAATYDEIVAAFSQGQLSAREARARIESLTARDDAGVEWSIDAVTGQWQYRTLDGRLRAGDPPTWGLASLTPHDLGSGSANPDRRVAFYEMDPSRESGGLVNATRRAQPVGFSQRARAAGAGRVALFTLGIIIGAAVAMFVFVR